MAWPPSIAGTWSAYGTSFPEHFTWFDTDGDYIYMSDQSNDVYLYNPGTDGYSHIGSSTELTGLTGIAQIAYYNGGLILVGKGVYNFEIWNWSGSLWTKVYFSNSCAAFNNHRLRISDSFAVATAGGQATTEDGFAVISSDGVSWSLIAFSDDPQTWRVPVDDAVHWNTHGLGDNQDNGLFSITIGAGSRNYYSSGSTIQLIGSATYLIRALSEVYWGETGSPTHYAWSTDMSSWTEPTEFSVLPFSPQNYYHAIGRDSSDHLRFWDNDIKQWETIIYDDISGLPSMDRVVIVLNSGQPFLTDGDQLYSRSENFDPPVTPAVTGNRLWVYKTEDSGLNWTSRGVGST